MKKRLTITLDEKILKNVDSVIDLLYIRNRSQAIEFLVGKSLGENKVAVILASGPSEQLKVSKNEYRPTARIKESSVIEMAIKNLRENGFKRIYVLGEQPVLTSIFNLIGDGGRYGVKIEFVENENSSGTAASLRSLKGVIKSTFLVVAGDTIFNKEGITKLWTHHFKHPAIATIMVTSSNLILGGSNVPIRKSPLKVEGNTITKVFPRLTKGLKDSAIIFASIFVAEPEIMEYSGNWLEDDVFPKLADKGFLYSYLSSEEEFHIHSKEDARFVKI